MEFFPLLQFHNRRLRDRPKIIAVRYEGNSSAVPPSNPAETEVSGDIIATTEESDQQVDVNE